MEPARHLLLHYHLFKNAGSSVDVMLRRNFPDTWVYQEFKDTKPNQNAALVEKFLRENRRLDAVSSHTALFPLPEIPGVSVFPIIFIRHPLLRLKSAFGFELKQTKKFNESAVVAKEKGFIEYIKFLIAHPGRMGRNFQSRRLAFGIPARAGSQVERAFLMMERLPFIGLVESYDKSIEHLSELLKDKLPNFNAVVAHANASESKERPSYQEQLAVLRKELGISLYDEAMAANMEDFAIFTAVRCRYGG